jgi:hypothetical protein
MALFDMYPQTLTFSAFKEEMPKPTIVMQRDGTLRPKDPCLERQHITVFLKPRSEWIEISAAQYRAIIQFTRVVLRHNSMTTIIFNAGASPWGMDDLHDYDERWMTIPEGMKARSINIRKVLLRKKPLHRVVRQRQAQARDAKNETRST